MHCERSGCTLVHGKTNRIQMEKIQDCSGSHQKQASCQDQSRVYYQKNTEREWHFMERCQKCNHCGLKTMGPVPSLPNTTWMFHNVSEKMFYGQMREKSAIFQHKCTILRKKNAAHQLQNLTPTVKYGGGTIMVWICFAASGPGHLAIIEGKLY